MLPEFVKKRETSSPRSAKRAIFSAEAAFPDLLVFFIKLLLLFRRFPQSYKMVVLAVRVFSHLKDKGIEPGSNPTNRTLLFRNVQTLIEIERMREDLLRLFKSDSSPGVAPQLFALAQVEVEPHTGITVIPHNLTVWRGKYGSGCCPLGYFAPCPFSALPAIAPVAFPFSNATWPFTRTCFTPSASCAGWVYVALSTM